MCNNKSYIQIQDLIIGIQTVYRDNIFMKRSLPTVCFTHTWNNPLKILGLLLRQNLSQGQLEVEIVETTFRCPKYKS